MKTMKYAQKFIVNPAFRVEKFDNEFLLYAVSTTRGLYLNETACLVWELCAQGHTVEEIIALLRTAYPQQQEMIRQDVVAAIESLAETGALIAGND